jgi:hypothetical protein
MAVLAPGTVTRHHGNGVSTLVFMNDIAKMLVLIGLALAALGGLLWLGGKLPWFGRLPGDIRIDREHFKLYFPLTTCLLLSILLTVLFRLLGKR